MHRPTVLAQIDRSLTYHARQRRRWERNCRGVRADLCPMLDYHAGALDALALVRDLIPDRVPINPRRRARRA